MASNVTLQRPIRSLPILEFPNPWLFRLRGGELEIVEHPADQR